MRSQPAGLPVSSVAAEYIVECPHGAKVYRVSKASVTLFVHEDGSPCDHFNSLAKPAEEDLGGLRLSEISRVSQLLERPQGLATVMESKKLLGMLGEELLRDDEAVFKLCKHAPKLIEEVCKIVDRKAVVGRVVSVIDQRGRELDITRLLPIISEFLSQG